MRLLILSVGTRNALVEEFRKKLELIGGMVIAADCSQYAPALYCANKQYIVPRCDAPDYLDKVINICVSQRITHVISLLDPELSVLSKNVKKFEKIGVTVALSSYETNEICYNKYEMYRVLKQNDIPHILTFDNVESVIEAIERESVKFPVVLKDKKGSASQNVRVIHSARELVILFEKNDNQLVQEFINGDEYGIDVYVDAISNKPITIFQKKKLRMRAGETDKSIAVYSEKLETLILRVVDLFNLKYVSDIDVFEVDGEFYISEINPRFGGGYLHASHCGVDFIDKMINNFKGIENNVALHNYPIGSVMMKYQEAMFIDDGE